MIIFIPYSLLPIPYYLLPATCSLFPVPFAIDRFLISLILVYKSSYLSNYYVN
ncbi:MULTISPECIES: hypothetical protein [unclassified Moorena]|uniref:hypothetical protein n=1 Tax=unclassified Moorena TaxID=2683338 RepID=UPI0013FFCF1D|nr:MULTISPECIES: hypothetical protein [unclassified Moorena]NEO14742.1 hypothetical protein [Moorena sp. SIO3E8]NEQ00549.1 hypothetical protein [Moorena sp. SIO3F7]